MKKNCNVKVVLYSVFIYVIVIWNKSCDVCGIDSAVEIRPVSNFYNNKKPKETEINKQL